MFWNLLAKILLDVLVGLLVELAVVVCLALLRNYRQSCQRNFGLALA